MPIYAYRCATCGHAKDVLRKMSDPPLAECPACGAPTFVKQVTAAGFQLKGSGWYVTDFKGGGAAPKTGETADKTTDGSGDKAGDKPAGNEAAKPHAGQPGEAAGSSVKADAKAGAAASKSDAAGSAAKPAASGSSTPSTPSANSK